VRVEREQDGVREEMRVMLGVVGVRRGVWRRGVVLEEE
jgi:hypothetical protein